MVAPPIDEPAIEESIPDPTEDPTQAPTPSSTPAASAKPSARPSASATTSAMSAITAKPQAKQTTLVSEITATGSSPAVQGIAIGVLLVLGFVYFRILRRGGKRRTSRSPKAEA